jgi:NadR type nicotinamide-nucleotide adenylyltransferase
MKPKKIKIVVTGPESSGKTTLIKDLAAHYNEPFAEEFARTYFEGYEGKYHLLDIQNIAVGQLEANLKNEKKAKKIAFSDTDTTVINIWAQLKFNATIPVFDEDMEESKPDLYLLCAPDFPWVYDTLRENPDDRLDIFEAYTTLLNRLKSNYVVIKGSHETRMNIAINEINKILNQ